MSTILSGEALYFNSTNLLSNPTHAIVDRTFPPATASYASASVVPSSSLRFESEELRSEEL
jgi:hypothetical protein